MPEKERLNIAAALKRQGTQRPETGPRLHSVALHKSRLDLASSNYHKPTEASLTVICIAWEVWAKYNCAVKVLIIIYKRNVLLGSGGGGGGMVRNIPHKNCDISACV